MGALVSKMILGYMVKEGTRELRVSKEIPENDLGALEDFLSEFAKSVDPDLGGVLLYSVETDFEEDE